MQPEVFLRGVRFLPQPSLLPGRRRLAYPEARLSLSHRLRANGSHRSPVSALIIDNPTFDRQSRALIYEY